LTFNPLLLAMNRPDVRTLIDPDTEPSQRREHVRPRCLGPSLREPRLAHERNLQLGEDLGDLGSELDAGQAATDDRYASLMRRSLPQRLMDAGDGSEFDRQRMLADTFHAVDVDMRAESEHGRVEMDTIAAAQVQRAIADIHLLDDSDAQLDAAAPDERRQAPIAHVLSGRALMQTDALYETIGSADERDADIRRYASRQAQGAADAGITRAGNDDAMVFHARQTGQAQRL
jgi:hypothetical protein